MIIVAGHLTVKPDQRLSMLDKQRDIIAAARAAPGCLTFHLSADPVEDDRINVFERWDSKEAVEVFRGSGPTEDEQEGILGADVVQYEISNATSLT